MDEYAELRTVVSILTSAWEVSRARGNDNPAMTVSILTSAWEVSMILCAARAAHRFQFSPPRGRCRIADYRCRATRVFQFSPPRGRCRPGDRLRNLYKIVSILTSAWEVSTAPHANE